jgi:hypothetical protein
MTTETAKSPQPRTKAPHSCAVCSNIERRLVDMALGYSPRLLSRKFRALTRKQIQTHHTYSQSLRHIAGATLKGKLVT